MSTSMIGEDDEVEVDISGTEIPGGDADVSGDVNRCGPTVADTGTGDNGGGWFFCCCCYSKQNVSIFSRRWKSEI